MEFLYKIFDNPFASKTLKQVVVPNFITDNLSFQIRPYQIESFKRYIFLDREEFNEKPKKPFHLLYNMATGSGKTLVMAGLILYLYEKGYRNFLFFVNSDNIITKTKDNFLNANSSKYLFSQKIVVDGREVVIKAVDNFDEADTENINIHFTTIHKLHSDLNNTKENSVTYEDFEDRKLVLIADEAHHLSSSTKNKQIVLEQTTPSWENTVDKILHQNFSTILLEFTATLDYDNQAIVEKYKDKVIQKYSLKEFRIDKYSKEIHLIRSLYEEKERIIQSLILNLYRQELATSKGINLKPVILFKAKRTIKESEQNKINFHNLIENFSETEVKNIQETSMIDVVQKAFLFFENQNISFTDISERIKSNFREENCISANNDKEAEQNQLLLNTLEESNNPVRAVFAVQKLNEGWDVLNLFDIVRLYEGQNSGGKTKGTSKTTLSEAQLIGRGARYFPFKLENEQDAYKRKYDNEPKNDLKVLEELYYHTKEDNHYISELTKALVESGIYEGENKLETKKLLLKENFQKTDFHKIGKVFFNKKNPKSYNTITSFEDLGLKRKDFSYTLSSGAGIVSKVFLEEESEQTERKKLEELEKNSQKNISITQIIDKKGTINGIHIIRYALSKNPFYYFDNLIRYFPNLKSISDFIESESYLSSLGIIFKGSEKRLSAISNKDYLLAIQGLLQSIEIKIKANQPVLFLD